MLILFRNAMECESAKVKYVEGASHWVQQDQPETVNSDIEKFLDGLRE